MNGKPPNTLFTIGQHSPSLPLLAFLAAVLLARPLFAQVIEQAGALPPAEVEQLDSASAAHLENAKRFLAAQQWGEAVESIRRVQEIDPSRLVRVDLSLPVAGFERYVTAGEYCQWRLAALASEAPQALTLYRGLVDPLAENWFREGERTNDELLLRRVVQQAFASRFGDDALLKLGDLALARGDPASARASWQRISPQLSVPPSAAAALHAPAGNPLWLSLRRFDFAANGRELAVLLNSPGPLPLGTYPDTDLDLGAVQARLVLASLFEGSRERAAVELSLLKLLYPQAEGQLAGRRGRYVDLLQSLLEESAGWAAPRLSPDWPTYDGDDLRGKVAAVELDPAGKPLWTYALPRLTADREVMAQGRLRPADDARSLLSYHPVVVDGKVLVRVDARGSSYVVALDLHSGKRSWQVDYSRGLTVGSQAEVAADKPFEVSDAHAGLAQHVGVARYTLSVQGSKVFARLGSPVSIPSARRAALWLAKDQGFLLGLDLATQGKPLEGFPIRPPSNEWTFEGTPLPANGRIYVAMRRVEGGRSQLHLATYELQTAAVGQINDQGDDARPAGRLKWRTRLCSEATLGGGQLDELSNLLVTLDGGRVYLNTNSGAVAALSADSGQLLWLIKYPRTAAGAGNPNRPRQHLFRDLTPCLAWKDLVIVAPSDSDRIFALEAATGQLAWSLPAGAADDVMHLLGVEGDALVASGDSLYWIDAHTGRMLTQFPAGALGSSGEAAPAPRGLGRGVIAGSHVWWPTRENIYVFDAHPAATDFGNRPKLIREIPLLPRRVTGGNLVIADGVLLIATGDRLTAFGQ